MASSNSSKTAHVMNLLSKNRGGAPASGATAEPPAVEPPPAEKIEKAERTAPVAPLISSINADAAVASQIKDALEAELSDGPSAAAPAPAQAAPPQPAETPSAPPSAEELMDLPPMKPAEPESSEEGYVNVMQVLVEEKAEKYMRMFGICCCDRCQLDVKAFALNHLPPKYVFMGPDDRVPRLTVYESKYNSDITAQLLKACTVVSQTPHHSRPL